MLKSNLWGKSSFWVLSFIFLFSFMLFCNMYLQLRMLPWHAITLRSALIKSPVSWGSMVPSWSSSSWWWRALIAANPALSPSPTVASSARYSESQSTEFAAKTSGCDSGCWLNSHYWVGKHWTPTFFGYWAIAGGSQEVKEDPGQKDVEPSGPAGGPRRRPEGHPDHPSATLWHILTLGQYGKHCSSWAEGVSPSLPHYIPSPAPRPDPVKGKEQCSLSGAHCSGMCNVHRIAEQWSRGRSQGGGVLSSGN